MNDDSEFFIGWQGVAPPRTGRWLARITVVMGMLAVVGAATLAVLQGTIGRATWDYAHEREFTGILYADPVPTLVVRNFDLAHETTSVLLVDPNKFGFDPALARSLDREFVRLRGTVLRRDHQVLLEYTPGSAVRVGPEAAPDLSSVDLGEHVLRGEIVDSKCFLGAMNPGVLKPHRACAIRCISGGVPPILLVRSQTDAPVYYLLVGPDGETINRDVLDFVAEPVEIPGRVQRRGEQLVLRASPGRIKRLP